MNFVKIDELDFWIECEFMRYAPVCALELYCIIVLQHHALEVFSRVVMSLIPRILLQIFHILGTQFRPAPKAAALTTSASHNHIKVLLEYGRHERHLYM